MPWEHCEQTLADDEPCACGMTKGEWTVQLDMTRTIEVVRPTRRAKKRDAWIEVQLLGKDGRALAGADYRIALPGSRVAKGQLDDEGVARVEKLRAGTCEISFPGHIEQGAERETGERHVFRLAPALLYSF